MMAGERRECPVLERNTMVVGFDVLAGVVGCRGSGAASRFLRGSGTSRVATHARTSALVVHGDD